MDKLFVTILGILGILATYWFFFGKKEQAEEAKGGSLTIRVEGGYKPDKIILQRGKTSDLKFIRSDSNSCLEEVVIPEFKIRKYLPLNKEVVIPLTPTKKGEFSLSCGMNMFHGKIIVV